LAVFIPLVNGVLAAVPHEAASGAGGIFSTSEQLGGALGVAIIGSVSSTGSSATRSPPPSSRRRRS
jgi:hypothetical protein